MQRSLMGVVHLGPCPSARRATAAFDEVLERALADARALGEGGVDAIMVENFGDAPFHKGSREDPVPPDVPAALAVAARAIRLATGLPVGINCLRNDGIAALGAAAVAGARFVRVNVLTGSMVTDQGLIDGEAARLAAYGRQLAGPAPILLADLLVKHASPLAALDPAGAARDLAERSGAGGLVLTGSRTGEPVDEALLDQVQAAVPTFPIWIGSGVRPERAAALWSRCAGLIVGTALKVDGRVEAPVDPARVAALRRLLPA
jgi:membrane complex biogenesis BtpA family protein